jgi:glutaminyl-peptide cyclotransferase
VRRSPKFCMVVLLCVACNSQPTSPTQTTEQKAAAGTSSIPPAPPASATGGFDASRAYEHVRRLVEIGPRPPGSEGIHRAQAYIVEQLKSYGCEVEEHDFRGPTPIGDIAMKNIIAKVPGTKSDIVLYTAHYDTLRMPDFVGANDGASSTAVVLELARNFCARKNALNVWIVFFDGEEAQGQWSDRQSVQWTAANNTMGSREMAASLALSGQLKQVKAMILADLIGGANLKLKRDSNSTPWLTDLLWATAGRLGYGKVFVNEMQPGAGDDHMSFIRRGVAGCDLLDFSYPYWHTTQDTLDKVDPQSLAIVGHVLVESLPELEKRFR